MAVCIAYFDASGNASANEQHRQLTVAGFVATESQWKRFDPKWEEVLEAAGISSFHANKFAHFVGEFSRGRNDEPWRIALIKSLALVIKRHVRKAFSESVFLDDYDAVNAEFELDTVCRPYTLCASQVISQTNRWMKGYHPKDVTLFVFEKGDLDQGHLEKLLAFRKMRLEHPPVIASKRRTENNRTRYVRPFEACDLWAYEDSLGLPIIGTGKRARGSMQYLSEQIPYCRGLYNATGLRAICDDLRIAKRALSRSSSTRASS